MVIRQIFFEHVFSHFFFYRVKCTITSRKSLESSLFGSDLRVTQNPLIRSNKLLGNTIFHFSRYRIGIEYVFLVFNHQRCIVLFVPGNPTGTRCSGNAIDSQALAAIWKYTVTTELQKKKKKNESFPWDKLDIFKALFIHLHPRYAIVQIKIFMASWWIEKQNRCFILLANTLRIDFCLFFSWYQLSRMMKFEKFWLADNFALAS